MKPKTKAKMKQKENLNESETKAKNIENEIKPMPENISSARFCTAAFAFEVKRFRKKYVFRGSKMILF